MLNMMTKLHSKRTQKTVRLKNVKSPACHPLQFANTQRCQPGPTVSSCFAWLANPTGHPLQAYFMAQKQQDEVKANPFTQQQYGNNSFNPQVRIVSVLVNSKRNRQQSFGLFHYN